MTPPFQTPDEHQHLFRAYQLSRLQLIGERRDNRSGGWVPPGFLRAAAAELDLSVDHMHGRAVPERPIADIFARSTRPAWDDPPVFVSSAVLYSPMGYVPQVLAIWIGQTAHLSVEAIIRLGRLLNAALAIGLIAWALRITPLGELPMMLVGLLPMTAASAAAFGQDALVIGAGFLLTALGLRVALRAGWQRLDFAAATLAGLAVVLSKVLYAPLIAVALVPLPSAASRRAWIGRIGFMLGVAVVMLAAWLWAVRGLAAPARPDLPTWAQQWHFMLEQPLRTAKSVARVFAQGRLAEEVVGVFGWLNVGPSRAALTIVPIALILGMLAGDPRARLLGWQRRLWCLALAVGMAASVALLMFLVYSPLGAYKIEGVQGRYLLPLLPLALIALLPACRRLPAAVPAALTVAAAMALANAASLLTIARDFYSP